METNRTLMHKQHVVTLQQLSCCAFICMAFLLHLFTNQFSATAYCLILFFLTVSFVISKPFILKGVPHFYLFVWIVALCVILINYLFRFRHLVVVFDGSILLLGFMFIVFFSKDSAIYTRTLLVIRKMALFFAVGVLIQRLIPSVYRVIIQVFPSTIKAALLSNMSSTGKIAGFTTNPGFAAGYIVAGIFAVRASAQQLNQDVKKNKISMLLFVVALLMTAKRGALLFMIMTIVIVRILPERGIKRFKKLWYGLMIALVLIVLFFLLQDALAQIPLLRRYIISVQGFLSGEDVSSGRERLSAWAITLFRENPVVGIGWGVFRTTTIGNATLTKSLDVHNVYLQLMCETGIVGFIAFALVFLLSWNIARKGYCACIQSEDPNLVKWAPALMFSFSFQTYFLLYCLTGNPLYDQFYQILYAFSCSVAVAYNFVSNSQMRPERLLYKSIGEV